MPLIYPTLTRSPIAPTRSPPFAQSRLPLRIPSRKGSARAAGGSSRRQLPSPATPPRRARPLSPGNSTPVRAASLPGSSPTAASSPARFASSPAGSSLPDSSPTATSCPARSSVKSLEGGLGKRIREEKPKEPENTATVLYIGHIPHGFYEYQMQGFFQQFGDVKRLRIARNHKTGKSKHYGFIEFENPEVAKIVADEMNNYMLFEHTLQIALVPPDKVHPKL